MRKIWKYRIAIMDISWAIVPNKLKFDTRLCFNRTTATSFHFLAQANDWQKQFLKFVALKKFFYSCYLCCGVSVCARERERCPWSSDDQWLSCAWDGRFVGVARQRRGGWGGAGSAQGRESWLFYCNCHYL